MTSADQRSGGYPASMPAIPTFRSTFTSGFTRTASSGARSSPQPRRDSRVTPSSARESAPIGSGDYEEIMNKVSALSVLSNAVLV